MKKFYLLTLFQIAILSINHAQAITPFTLNVSGKSATSGYYRFDWSVGEMCVIDTWNQPNLAVTNGLLFPFTENLSSANIDFFAIGDIRIFPNPVVDKTELNILVPQHGTVSLRITDAQGKTVYQKQFAYSGTGHIEKLDLSAFSAGAYFLTLQLDPTESSKPLRKGTYKLVHVSR